MRVEMHVYYGEEDGFAVIEHRGEEDVETTEFGQEDGDGESVAGPLEDDAEDVAPELGGEDCSDEGVEPEPGSEEATAEPEEGAEEAAVESEEGVAEPEKEGGEPAAE